MKRSTLSGSVLAFAGTLVFLSGAVAQTTDRRLDEIRRIEVQTNRMAEDAEGTEFASVFVVELNVNRRENPYPAVGRYSTTARFYYTYGDREKNPYPDRLIKASIETRRSSTTEQTGLFFNAAGALVLYTRNIDGDRPSITRLYISAGRIIRLEKDGKNARTNSREALGLLTEANAENIRLVKIFRASLE